jgi:hypothetical protein
MPTNPQDLSATGRIGMLVRMRRTVVTCAAAILAGCIPAQETRPESAPAPIAPLREEYEVLRRKFQDAVGNLPDTRPEDSEAFDKLLAAFREQSAGIATKLLSIAESRPKDPAAVEAIQLALQTGIDDRKLASAVRVLGEHATSDLIADVIPALEGYAGKDINALLEKVIAHNPRRDVKGLAVFHLAMRTRPRAAHEKLLERLIAEFADVEVGEDTLGGLAERRLFALRNLQVGMKAPDIAGKDMDGVDFKLSDYRGKVVVLDFWGFW